MNDVHQHLKLGWGSEGKPNHCGTIPPTARRWLRLYPAVPQRSFNARGSEPFGMVIDLDVLLPGSGIPTVQTLKPRTERQAPKSHYSGIFGLDEFPLHTDLAHWAMPPRYFMLRCIHGSPDVTTKLLPATVMMDAVGSAGSATGLGQAAAPQSLWQSWLANVVVFLEPSSWPEMGYALSDTYEHGGC